jgi:hypothetical protein
LRNSPSRGKVSQPAVTFGYSLVQRVASQLEELAELRIELGFDQVTDGEQQFHTEQVLGEDGVHGDVLYAVDR